MTPLTAEQLAEIRERHKAGFIADAHEDIPALLQHIEELDKQVVRWKAAFYKEDARWMERRASASAELEACRNALDTCMAFTRHGPVCMWPLKKCDCGLAELTTRAKAALAGGERK